jgi:iron-sulfur cluster assembly protein
MVTLSATAAEKLREILVSEGAADKGLRVRVVPGGCSGYQYDMVFDEAGEGDHVYDSEGLRLLVDGESHALVDGSEIDYREELGQAGFTIKNPNAAGGCGCGKSFQT